MRELIDKYFNLTANNTSIKTEVVAGLATFVTMAYIIVVNPVILEAAGIPFGPSMVATIISAIFGTLLMGFYAKRPFAVAPYMGENAFVAYTVSGTLGYSWQTAIGAVFIGGVIFTILAFTGARQIVNRAIPAGLKYSFAVGIGLFIAFIGLVDGGIVTVGTEGAPVHIGNLTDKGVWLTIVGFILISILLIRRVKGALLIGIIVTAMIGFAIGVGKLPEQWVSLPPSMAPIFLKLDIMGAFSWGFLAVILSMFTMGFLDTVGTVVGLSAKAGFLDGNGNLPEIQKPMLVDAMATVFGALMGTTTTGAYIESATGIEEGGRTGLMTVVVAILFISGLFFSPLFIAIPASATAPALIIVGLLMMGPIVNINFSDYTEVIPAFAVIVLMSFTYNIGVGLCGGFVLFPICKVIAGKFKEVHPAAWALFALCLLFFIFYLY